MLRHYYIYLFFLCLLTIRCSSNKQEQKKESVVAKNIQEKVVKKVDTSYYYPTYNISSKGVINTSNLSIDVIYNSIEGFLDGKRNNKVWWGIEWITGEPFKLIDSGFLLGNRITVHPNIVKYYSENIKPPTYSKVKTFVGSGRTESIPNFGFSAGTGSIKDVGVSCNDASYKKITLKFKKGYIEIDKLLNATFFEHDLDKDGQPEQYIFGYRSCSQEFALLRISDK